ncbi:hypothetical protein [Jidongwangia harbinensis]|uniref:hypothetical protein n=1 Tax=Jidongwangia harbinensis TaxID=2878561 RepID=UPI001CDA555C|nr:hypothetical protein [Jidongwangia harbinensis]MCA2211270.1 hypothetical protein [Jidongwangia harbinensis]
MSIATPAPLRNPAGVTRLDEPVNAVAMVSGRVCMMARWPPSNHRTAGVPAGVAARGGG